MTAPQLTDDTADPANSPALQSQQSPPRASIVVPQSQEPPKQHTTSSKEDDLMKGIPPSKLLHSVPGEHPKGANTLKRTDSETREDEEFHDALA